jgi:hypothetical protein
MTQAVKIAGPGKGGFRIPVHMNLCRLKCKLSLQKQSRFQVISFIYLFLSILINIYLFLFFYFLGGGEELTPTISKTLLFWARGQKHRQIVDDHRKNAQGLSKHLMGFSAKLALALAAMSLPS